MASFSSCLRFVLWLSLFICSVYTTTLSDASEGSSPPPPPSSSRVASLGSRKRMVNLRTPPPSTPPSPSTMTDTKDATTTNGTDDVIIVHRKLSSTGSSDDTDDKGSSARGSQHGGGNGLGGVDFADAHLVAGGEVEAMMPSSSSTNNNVVGGGGGPTKSHIRSMRLQMSRYALQYVWTGHTPTSRCFTPPPHSDNNDVVEVNRRGIFDMCRDALMSLDSDPEVLESRFKMADRIKKIVEGAMYPPYGARSYGSAAEQRRETLANSATTKTSSSSPNGGTSLEEGNAQWIERLFPPSRTSDGAVSTSRPTIVPSWQNGYGVNSGGGGGVGGTTTTIATSLQLDAGGIHGREILLARVGSVFSPNEWGAWRECRPLGGGGSSASLLLPLLDTNITAPPNGHPVTLPHLARNSWDLSPIIMDGWKRRSSSRTANSKNSNNKKLRVVGVDTNVLEFNTTLLLPPWVQWIGDTLVDPPPPSPSDEEKRRGEQQQQHPLVGVCPVVENSTYDGLALWECVRGAQGYGGTPAIQRGCHYPHHNHDMSSSSPTSPSALLTTAASSTIVLDLARRRQQECEDIYTAAVVSTSYSLCSTTASLPDLGAPLMRRLSSPSSPSNNTPPPPPLSPWYQGAHAFQIDFEMAKDNDQGKLYAVLPTPKTIADQLDLRTLMYHTVQTQVSLFSSPHVPGLRFNTTTETIQRSDLVFEYAVKWGSRRSFSGVEFELGSGFRLRDHGSADTCGYTAHSEKVASLGNVSDMVDDDDDDHPHYYGERDEGYHEGGHAWCGDGHPHPTTPTIHTSSGSPFSIDRQWYHRRWPFRRMVLDRTDGGDGTPAAMHSASAVEKLWNLAIPKEESNTPNTPNTPPPPSSSSTAVTTTKESSNPLQRSKEAQEALILAKLADLWERRRLSSTTVDSGAASSSSPACIENEGGDATPCEGVVSGGALETDKTNGPSPGVVGGGGTLHQSTKKTKRYPSQYPSPIHLKNIIVSSYEPLLDKSVLENWLKSSRSKSTSQGCVEKAVDYDPLQHPLMKAALSQQSTKSKRYVVSHQLLYVRLVQEITTAVIVTNTTTKLGFHDRVDGGGVPSTTNGGDDEVITVSTSKSVSSLNTSRRRVVYTFVDGTIGAVHHTSCGTASHYASSSTLNTTQHPPTTTNSSSQQPSSVVASLINGSLGSRSASGAPVVVGKAASFSYSVFESQFPGSVQLSCRRIIPSSSQLLLFSSSPLVSLPTTTNPPSPPPLPHCGRANSAILCWFRDTLHPKVQRHHLFTQIVKDAADRTNSNLFNGDATHQSRWWLEGMASIWGEASIRIPYLLTHDDGDHRNDSKFSSLVVVPSVGVRLWALLTQQGGSGGVDQVASRLALLSLLSKLLHTNDRGGSGGGDSTVDDATSTTHNDEHINAKSTSANSQHNWKAALYVSIPTLVRAAVGRRIASVVASSHQVLLQSKTVHHHHTHDDIYSMVGSVVDTSRIVSVGSGFHLPSSSSSSRRQYTTTTATTTTMPSLLSPDPSNNHYLHSPPPPPPNPVNRRAVGGREVGSLWAILTDAAIDLVSIATPIIAVGSSTTTNSLGRNETRHQHTALVRLVVGLEVAFAWIGTVDLDIWKRCVCNQALLHSTTTAPQNYSSWSTLRADLITRGVLDGSINSKGG